MSQSPLASFDPFAPHPFTNINNGFIAMPPPPSQYPRPIPSTHAPPYPYHPTSPSSLPGSHNTTPLAAPKPQYASSPPSSSASSTSSTPHAKHASKGIFVTFKPDGRSTPDLEDILAKKKVLQTWGQK
ncbi:hypothetical protein BV25DRAFT_1839389 [Artomyces pyxidatus]|uniref:Uncharacterized protein n=1 Tax=Artomyces pyxidatus TaxID=48021 RepID=A0ACB8SWD0_9AGAM|nr:hypothetical protein BV25DRAFT_1839389 [Artomyces pyxidatus]